MGDRYLFMSDRPLCAIAPCAATSLPTMLNFFPSRRSVAPIKTQLERGAAAIAALAIVTMSAVDIHPAIAQGIVTAPTRTDLSTAGMTFKQAMDLGYAASRQGDLHTALINFQRALLIQPGNQYAAAAADNMAYYIQHGRVSARQQAINQLHARLATATEQKDWVCAATTLDQLTTYTTPNSLNRERIIGQRGEVSGLLDARIDHEQWSTVCSAQGPIY